MLGYWGSTTQDGEKEVLHSTGLMNGTRWSVVGLRGPGPSQRTANHRASGERQKRGPQSGRRTDNKPFPGKQRALLPAFMTPYYPGVSVMGRELKAHAPGSLLVPEQGK